MSAPGGEQGERLRRPGAGVGVGGEVLLDVVNRGLIEGNMAVAAGVRQGVIALFQNLSPIGIHGNHDGYGA